MLRRGALGALLAASYAATAQEPSQTQNAGPTRAALEEARATIRAINVTVDNVFDPSNPDEDKALYRWANRVHVLSREKVIEDMLLFAQGDRFVARLLDESARALRAGGFIAEAVIEPGSYDPATNSVDVTVRVRDAWSLQFDLKLDHKGGQTEWGIGLSENNLFGTGKTLEVGYESEIDRDQWRLGYGDGNVFGSRVRLRALFANASDGHRRELNVERPFYSLDTRWSVGGAVHGEERIDGPVREICRLVDRPAPLASRGRALLDALRASGLSGGVAVAPITWQDVRGWLAPNELLLTYVISEERLFGFAVSRERLVADPFDLLLALRRHAAVIR